MAEPGRPRPGRLAPTAHAPVGDGYMLVGASLCGGRAYAWLNEVVRAWLGELTQDPPQAGERRGDVLRQAVYQRMNELAAAAASDCGGLAVATTFSGTRADPTVRGAFSGISLENFTLGNVARAVLTGMVDELASYYESAATESSPAMRARSSPELVVASGNAVRRNPLLRRLIGERFGRSVRIPRHREEAAYGAALLAGVAAGVWLDLAAAGQCLAYE